MDYPLGGTEAAPAAPTPGGFGHIWVNLYPQYYSVIHAGGQYVAVGELGAIKTSPDGKTWTDRISGTRWSLFDVAWNGQTYVAVGDQGVILVSHDAVTWTARPPVMLSVKRFAAITFSGNKFVVVGPGGLYSVSDDGTTWNSGMIGGGVIVGPAQFDVAYGNGKFVAVG